MAIFSNHKYLTCSPCWAITSAALSMCEHFYMYLQNCKGNQASIHKRAERRRERARGTWCMGCPYFNIFNLELCNTNVKKKNGHLGKSKTNCEKKLTVGWADAPAQRKPAETEKFWNAALHSDFRVAWLVAGENLLFTVSFDDWLSCSVSHSPALEKDLTFLPQWQQFQLHDHQGYWSLKAHPCELRIGRAEECPRPSSKGLVSSTLGHEAFKRW